MGNCANCRNIECRCADCFALVEVDGKWYCDDAEEFCKEIEYCWSYDGAHADCEEV